MFICDRFDIISFQDQKNMSTFFKDHERQSQRKINYNFFIYNKLDVNIFKIDKIFRSIFWTFSRLTKFSDRYFSGS